MFGKIFMFRKNSFKKNYVPTGQIWIRKKNYLEKNFTFDKKIKNKLV